MIYWKRRLLEATSAISIAFYRWIIFLLPVARRKTAALELKTRAINPATCRLDALLNSESPATVSLDPPSAAVAAHTIARPRPSSPCLLGRLINTFEPFISYVSALFSLQGMVRVISQAQLGNYQVSFETVISLRDSKAGCCRYTRLRFELLKRCAID